MNGLIMEGGAMRGLFTCGIIDVLLENEITFDGAIGVSAGASMGCNYKSKQIGRALRYLSKYGSDPRFGSVQSFLKTGNVFDVDFCYKTLPFELDIFDEATFNENPMKFYVVCTDVHTGEGIYHEIVRGKEEVLWLAASSAMPLLSKIMHLDGYDLLDGGVADSIPVKKMEELGYDHNVVILTQPEGFVKQKLKYVPLAKLMYRQYPKFVAALENRHIHYNDALAYIKAKKENNELFVLAPKAPLNISPMESNPKEFKRVYEMGRAVALENLDALKAYLATH